MQNLLPFKGFDNVPATTCHGITMPPMTKVKECQAMSTNVFTYSAQVDQ